MVKTLIREMAENDRILRQLYQFCYFIVKIDTIITILANFQGLGRNNSV